MNDQPEKCVMVNGRNEVYFTCNISGDSVMWEKVADLRIWIAFIFAWLLRRPFYVRVGGEPPLCLVKVLPNRTMEITDQHKAAIKTLGYSDLEADWS